MSDIPLFDETTRRKLEQLMLYASRVRAGAIKGDRRSSKRGTSIELRPRRRPAPPRLEHLCPHRPSTDAPV
jgi:hypothetical protein